MLVQRAYIEMLSRIAPAAETVLLLRVEHGLARVSPGAAGRVALFVEGPGEIDLLWSGALLSGEEWSCPLPPCVAVVAAYLPSGALARSAAVALLRDATAWTSCAAT